MTTTRDGLKDRILKFGEGFTEEQGTQGDAWADPNKEYPTTNYDNQPSTNETAKSGLQHNLKIGAGVNLPQLGSSAPNSSDTNQSVSGHVFEMNDTPGAERVLIKHNTGCGIDIRPDGTIVVIAGARKVEVTHGEQTVVVEGDGTLTYKGNLTLNVDGDFEVNCNNYKVNAKGNKTENIEGNSRTSIFGNFGHKVSGNFSQTIAGSSVNTFLGNTTNAIKGTYKNAVEGDIILASSGTIEQTAEAKIQQASPDINVAAQSLSLFGDTGTIGGENIIAYVKNIYGVSGDFSARFKAPVFEGDLEGNARTATTAGTSLHQSYNDGTYSSSSGAGVSPGSYTPGLGSNPNYTVDDTAIDDTATAMPTADILKKYLEEGNNGIKQVKVDIDDYLKNILRLRKLSTADVRSKMRDPLNFNDGDFTTSQVGEGNLSPDYAAAAPPKGFGRVRTARGTTQTNSEYFGNVDPSRKAKTFTVPNNRKVFTLLNNFTTLIDNATFINSKTKISEGITLSRFIGGVDSGPFDNLTLTDKKQLARNYIAHMELTKRCMGITSKWSEHELRVIEGFYAKELYGKGGPPGLKAETITDGGLLDLRTKGQAVVYELYGPDGFIDAEGTYDLASELADIGLYDKLTLDYDSFDPSGSINTQLMVSIPSVPLNYNIIYEQVCQTIFNNKVQSSNSFVEPIFDNNSSNYVPETPPTQRNSVA